MNGKVVLVKVSGLTWEQASYLGKMSRCGDAVIESTGDGYLKVTHKKLDYYGRFWEKIR